MSQIFTYRIYNISGHIWVLGMKKNFLAIGSSVRKFLLTGYLKNGKSYGLRIYYVSADQLYNLSERSFINHSVQNKFLLARYLLKGRT